jgi:transposase
MPSKPACVGSRPLIGLPSGAPSPDRSCKRCIPGWKCSFPASPAEAIRYALSRWEGLTRFLHDGRIELDTNPVERAIRPVALGRKNHLFAGSDGGGERWAIICSLIETCKLNDVEPYAYLNDVLTRMADGHPVNRLDELLPWVWKPEVHVKT